MCFDCFYPTKSGKVARKAYKRAKQPEYELTIMRTEKKNALDRAFNQKGRGAFVIRKKKQKEDSDEEEDEDEETENGAAATGNNASATGAPRKRNRRGGLQAGSVGLPQGVGRGQSTGQDTALPQYGNQFGQNAGLGGLQGLGIGNGFDPALPQHNGNHLGNNAGLGGLQGFGTGSRLGAAQPQGANLPGNLNNAGFGGQQGPEAGMPGRLIGYGEQAGHGESFGKRGFDGSELGGGNDPFAYGRRGMRGGYDCKSGQRVPRRGEPHNLGRACGDTSSDSPLIESGYFDGGHGSLGRDFPGHSGGFHGGYCGY